MKEYEQISEEYRSRSEQRMINNMLQSFEESVTATMEWLETDEAKQYFQNRQYLLSRFLEESGLEDEWTRIINERANKGVDITDEIYKYVRNLNHEGNDLVHFTPNETRVFNRLCDYNYGLIKNVCTDEIKLIREKLIDDYAKGRNPLQSSLSELQLEPINGLSPEARVEMIARTETARAINTGNLETYRSDGVEYVELMAAPNCCDDCLEIAMDTMKEPVPVGEALDEPCIHPNCRCTWVPAINRETGTYITP